MQLELVGSSESKQWQSISTLSSTSWRGGRQIFSPLRGFKHEKLVHVAAGGDGLLLRGAEERRGAAAMVKGEAGKFHARRHMICGLWMRDLFLFDLLLWMVEAGVLHLI
jgi:hypothetical protein